MEVTESLPNLKKSSAAKAVAAMEARKEEDSKALRRQKPCVVMKRTVNGGRKVRRVPVEK